MVQIVVIYNKTTQMNKIVLIVSLFFLSSCSREIDYPFLVKNNTEYTLNEVGFDWCQGKEVFLIEPMSSINTSLTYKVSVVNLFSSGSLCVGINSYSDSSSSYQNSYGSSFGRNALNKKKNVIIINRVGDEFSIELE